MKKAYYAAGFIQGEYLEAWAAAETLRTAYDAAKIRMQRDGYSGARIAVKKITKRDYARARFQIEKESWHYIRLSDHRLSEKEFEAFFVQVEA